MSFDAATSTRHKILPTPRHEWPLLLSLATTALFFVFGQPWLADLSNPIWFACMLLWLLIVILLLACAIVRHAESLAVHLRESLGALVLTLSVMGSRS